MVLLVSLVALTCVAASAAVARLHPLSDAFIDRINFEQDSWRAGRNFPEDTPLEYLKRLNGVRKGDEARFEQLPIIEHGADLIADLPENFDPREKWPNCPSLNEIRDQGSCGSCWALGAASAMTDRICIHSKDNKQFHVSAEDIVACSGAKVGGCNGGDPLDAWLTWNSKGFVSGGNYNSSQGCMPYSIPGCIHHASPVDGLEPCSKDYQPTPHCTKQCRSGYNVTYDNDEQRGGEVHSRQSEEQIMAELYKNGPVEVDFIVYEDFLNYKEGVYHHHSGKMLGGHAVKLMGWGTENGKKYWLLANSWNEHFGIQGYFKMLRGVNECGIEDNILFAEPLFN